MPFDVPATVELLEARRHLSADAVVRRERLVITGTDDNPTTIVVTLTPDRGRRVAVFIDGVEEDLTPRGGQRPGVSRERVRHIRITTGAGNDSIRLGTPDDPATPDVNEAVELRIGSTISAGAGDDTVFGG